MRMERELMATCTTMFGVLKACFINSSVRFFSKPLGTVRAIGGEKAFRFQSVRNARADIKGI